MKANGRWPIAGSFRGSIARCSEADAALASYRFDQYAKMCYDFFWGDFCDWYVEASKPALKNPATAGQTANVLAAVLDGALRLMHPMIPFITETIWWRLNEVRPQRGLPGSIECPAAMRLIKAAWPGAAHLTMPAECSSSAEYRKSSSAIRKIRNDYKVDGKKPVDGRNGRRPGNCDQQMNQPGAHRDPGRLRMDLIGGRHQAR